MNNPVNLSSRLDHAVHIAVGPNQLDQVSVPPGAVNFGPFEADQLPNPLPRGITTNPAGVNTHA